MSLPLIIAHRGASYDAPENTLSAFREAWVQGADGIEGDYCFTADSQVVCIHDDDTQRTGGRKLEVRESNYAELKKMEFGSWKDARFNGEPLPLLAEVLDEVPPGKWCVLELKTGPEIVSLLRSVLSASTIGQDRILVIAFDADTIRETKRQSPHLKAHWLTDYIQKEDGNWSPSASEIVQTIRWCGADGLGSENRPEVVTPDFIRQLRQAGIDEFHVWTVDRPDDARYFASLGAWGLTTNRPAFLRGHLAQT